MKLWKWPLSLLVAISFAISAENANSPISNFPPVVVKTHPQAGATDVDPNLTKVTAVYSKEMLDNSWSWGVVPNLLFPKLTGKPKYDADKRTCTLPVQLEPGKTYGIWLNAENLVGFKDAGGRTALPYLLVFQTKK